MSNNGFISHSEPLIKTQVRAKHLFKMTALYVFCLLPENRVAVSGFKLHLKKGNFEDI